MTLHRTIATQATQLAHLGQCGGLLQASMKHKIEQKRLAALERQRVSRKRGLDAASRTSALSPSVRHRIKQNRLVALERLRASTQRRLDGTYRGTTITKCETTDCVIKNKRHVGSTWQSLIRRIGVLGSMIVRISIGSKLPMQFVFKNNAKRGKSIL